MNAQIFYLCLLCGLVASAQAQTGIIGINTENPQGVLHIDGASTPATTNPQSGTVSAAQAADDVMVDFNGRLGAGTVSPAARVDLPTSTPGGAIRIQDGTQGEDRVLTSDVNGVGTWSPLAGTSWLAALCNSPLLPFSATTGVRPFVNYTDSVISDASLGGVNKTTGAILLPQTGKYRVTLSIYWIGNNSNGRTEPYPTKAILRVNGASRETFNFWSGRFNFGVLPTFINILELNAGDVLTLATDESVAAHANSAQAVLFMVELLL